MQTFIVRRETRSTIVECTTIEAESAEQAEAIAQEDEDNASIDWKEDYDEHDGWNYKATLASSLI